MVEHEALKFHSPGDGEEIVAADGPEPCTEGSERCAGRRIGDVAGAPRAVTDRGVAPSRR